MSSEWAMVIITGIYVIATIFICCANIKSANATKEQLTEAKRQFDEENRAHVTVTFDIIRSGLAVLCVENHGKQVANNVEVRISSEFIENIADSRDKELVKKMCKSSFTLGIGRRWYVCLGSHLELKHLSEVPLVIDITYSDNISEYKETTTIALEQYLWSLIYDSSTEDINQDLKRMANSIQKIEKTLSEK